MRTLVDGLSALLAAREIASLDEIRGRMSREWLAEPAALERASYIVTSTYCKGTPLGSCRSNASRDELTKADAIWT